MSVQSMMALETADEVRLGMATIKRNIRSLGYREGCELVATLLLYPSGHVPAMKTAQLLGAIYRAGDAAERIWLAKADIHTPDKRVRDLSERQRHALAAAVRKGRIR